MVKNQIFILMFVKQKNLQVLEHPQALSQQNWEDKK
jgi:hypothetical protein